MAQVPLDAGNNYARTILQFPCMMLQAGFRMWKRNALINLCPWTGFGNGYIFLVEMAYAISNGI